ncbi:tyrosine-type recombinase/integrase, partial [Geomonas propionica]|uniref:tyrosine-type recombinase/integrase n=1 Tax=Geomonas propionica TaxID=2798582 RepID=UPI001C07CACF
SGMLTEEQLQKTVTDLLYREKVQSRDKLLSEVIRMYLEEKSPNLKPRTLLGYETIFARNISIIGDRKVNAVKREDVIRLRSALISEGMKERTCNTHLVHLSSMLRWAVRQEICARNCAEGLLLTLSNRHDSERKRFSIDDLQSIFSNIPLIAGDETNVWIPLIALFSGMRKEEICQLERGDVRHEDGIWVFDINSKGEKTTKTEAGLRLVPIHSKLLHMGFIEFCNNRARGKHSGNLWGFVRWRESWCKRWGGRFNEWYSKNVQTDKGKVFHSFRHTFVDELKQSNLSKELVSELVGHVVKGETFGRYGKGYSVQVLKNAVEILSYDIDLTRLENHIGSCCSIS